MAQIFQFPTNKNLQNKLEQGFEDTIISSSEELYKGQEFDYLISKKQDLLEIFIHSCDPKTRTWELMHWGIKDLYNISQTNQSQLEQTISKLKNSPFHFSEDSKNFDFSRKLIVEDQETSNYIMNEFNLNKSQLTSIAYARAFDLFFDRYNGRFELESDLELFSRKEITYGLMKNSDAYSQETLNTVKQFPKINQNNFEEFLKFWRDLKFNDEINNY